MFPALLLAVAMGTLGDDGAASAAKPDSETYESVQAKAGKNADDQVRLALWCEAHGLSTERMKHLALAIRYDPTHALARGLLGLVSYQSEWKNPDQLTKELALDAGSKPKIDEYLERRAKVREKTDDLWKLAIWCEQNGLKQQAAAHFYQVLKLDPRRDAAWKHLGFKKLGGHWDKPERVAAAKAGAREQQKANTQWKPVLERWRAAIQSKDPSRRQEAERALAAIKDPLAVPMIWATFGRANAALQQVAVKLLGQIDDASASRALVMLAVFSGSNDVRAQAISELRRRDRREYAASLIAMILRPVKYEVKPVGGPGKPGELLIKGSGSTPNLKRIYAPPGTDPSILPKAGDRVRVDENGLAVVDRVTDLSLVEFSAANMFALQQQMLAYQNQTLAMLRQPGFGSQLTNTLTHSGLGSNGQKIGNLLIGAFETAVRQPPVVAFTYNPFYSMALTSYNGGIPLNPSSLLTYTVASGVEIPTGRIMVQAQQTAAMAQQQLDSDVESIKEYNASLGEINDRVVPVLTAISDQNIGPDPVAWQLWLNNLVGFNSIQASPPATVTETVPLAQPDPIPVGVFSGPVSVTRVSCFGAGTLVRSMSGMMPIESLQVGDLVLTQSSRTGALAYKPILAVHHNPPSRTYQLKLADETIVSSYFHRFWKAGVGWVMARDLKAGDRLRTIAGTTEIAAIDDGEVVPVYNLDVADDADFFVGKLGALAHDNTVPNLREVPFDGATKASPAHETAKRP
jgi:tetratricopeptide (TPR) repeat protein